METFLMLLGIVVTGILLVITREDYWPPELWPKLRYWAMKLPQ